MSFRSCNLKQHKQHVSQSHWAAWATVRYRGKFRLSTYRYRGKLRVSVTLSLAVRKNPPVKAAVPIICDFLRPTCSFSLIFSVFSLCLCLSLSLSVCLSVFLPLSLSLSLCMYIYIHTYIYNALMRHLVM